MESVGTAQRNKFGNMFHVTFPMGMVLLTAVAYYIRDWQSIMLWSSLPALLLNLNFVWVMDGVVEYLDTGGSLIHLFMLKSHPYVSHSFI